MTDLPVAKKLLAQEFIALVSHPHLPRDFTYLLTGMDVLGIVCWIMDIGQKPECEADSFVQRLEQRPWNQT